MPKPDTFCAQRKTGNVVVTGKEKQTVLQQGLL